MITHTKHAQGNNMRRTLTVAVISTVSSPILAGVPTWSYSIDFDNGNYLGGSVETFEFSSETQGDSFFRVTRNFDNGISVNLESPDPNDRGFYRFEIAIDGDVDPYVGLFEDATRFPFQDPGEHGLSASSPGRGYNMSLGNFTILDVAFDDEGEVLRFDIDFELAGDSDLTAGEFFRGSFRYAVPTPSTSAIIAMSALVVSRRRR